MLDTENRVFRCKSCDNCPFLDNGKKIHLHKDRVDDIKATLRDDYMNSFNCHKTAYKLGEDMKPSTSENQELKMCKGAYDYLKSIGRNNYHMDVDEAIHRYENKINKSKEKENVID